MNAQRAPAPAATVEATYKVGMNKGRPRIWIDGARLAAAGFTGGTEYALHYGPGRIAMLALAPGEPLPEGYSQRRRVTGRPDGKPIVDITGATVAEAFPGLLRVRVVFYAGRIAITAAD